METKKKMVNQLDVDIRHALITKLECELKTDNDGNPKATWTMRGHYMTGNGLKVAEFFYYTDSWSDDHKIELGEHDSHINKIMSEVFERFTGILYTKVNGQFAKLDKGKVDSSQTPF